MILELITSIFGDDLVHPLIQEALHYPDNQKIAQVGNDVLDLFNSLYLYQRKRQSAEIDKTRQLNFSKDNHRRIVNADIALVQHLLRTDYGEPKPRRIGLERSDSYLEGIIGAIYLEKGMQALESFIPDLYAPMVKCVDCSKFRPHGIMNPPEWVTNQDPIPLYICWQFPAPIENYIMSEVEGKLERKCWYFENRS